MQIEIWEAKTQKPLLTLNDVSVNDTVKDIKHYIHQEKHKLEPIRTAVRLEPRGKALPDGEKLSALNLPAKNAILYVRDLGPQVGYKTVFIFEYAGPFFIYPLFYFRPSIIYGEDAVKPIAPVVTLACTCWTIHYAKRLLETVFVHRFSHATMPRRNLIKNCSYYWGFAAFISYFINHPLYTPAEFGIAQIAAGLGLFAIGELGNLSIHLLLKNLRPPGSHERKIPYPNSNPLTLLFNYVSCPNYTYEVTSWIGFSLMTQTLPAIAFTTAGFGQMAVWALGKHRNYHKEFKNYPRGRKALVPFVL